MAKKSILRLTGMEATVKFYGAAGSTTIALATDLKLPTETITTPVVNIVGFQVTGRPGAYVSIIRNGESIYDCVTDNSPEVDLLALGGVSDGTNNTSDITITSTGGEAQLILKLRKVSGYKTTITPEQTGII